MKNANDNLAVPFAIAMLGAPWLGAISGSPAWSAINMLLLPVVALATSAVYLVVAASVALAFGDRVFQMAFGVGPQISVRTYELTSFIFKAIPFPPSIGIASAREKGQRFRIALALLAGNVAVAAAYIWVVTCPSRASLIRGFGSGPAWSSSFLVVGACTLYVTTFVTLGAVTGIPGLSNINEALLRSWRSMAIGQATTKLLMQQRHAEAEQLVRVGLATDPENAYLNLNLALALQMRTEHAEALTTLDAVLARELAEPFKPVARNLFAWSCYMLGDETRLASAEEASRLALQHAPNHPSYLDTRGHVLLWAGKPAEAESHLLRAHELATVDSTRAFAAAGLAIACHRQHRIDDAKAWLEKARTLRCDERVLARAIAEVEPLAR